MPPSSVSSRLSIAMLLATWVRVLDALIGPTRRAVLGDDFDERFEDLVVGGLPRSAQWLRGKFPQRLDDGD